MKLRLITCLIDPKYAKICMYICIFKVLNACYHSTTVAQSNQLKKRDYANFPQNTLALSSCSLSTRDGQNLTELN